MNHLFSPLKLRDITFSNRIGIPPMCQYSAQDGIATDWHFVHYGSRAVGGAALLIVEATAIAPEGRISPGDLGIWDDRHIAPLARIASFVQSQGSVAAIQLAHAGRKASVDLGWRPQQTLDKSAGGWEVLAPSSIAFGQNYAVPRELSEHDIRQVIAQFREGACRALEAGFQAIEIHAAHGYLLHQFLSPLSNQRSDQYGGSFANRTRLVREIVIAVREVWPEQLPLLIRLSATDWIAGGWDIEQTVELSQALKILGIDLIDVSSGGLSPDAVVSAAPGFQVEFAARIRQEVNIPTAAVGLITTPAQADQIIRNGQADMVLLGREILRNPYWPLNAARELGHAGQWSAQYLRAAPAGAGVR